VVVALALDAAELVLLAVDVAELVGEAAAQGLDVHLEAPGGQGEFGAELVLVGAELGHGHGRGRLDALFGQADGAAPDGGQDDERHEPGGKQAEHEIHNVFNDHYTAPPPENVRSGKTRPDNGSDGDALPSLPCGNLTSKSGRGHRGTSPAIDCERR